MAWYPSPASPGLDRGCAPVCGMPPYVAGIVSATPSLRLPWLAAAAAVALFAAIGASAPTLTGALLFLVIAPVVPLRRRRGRLRPMVRPDVRDGALDACLRGSTVMLARSVAVVVTAVAVLALAARLVAPGSVAWSWAWVLPALALSLSSLVLSTFTRHHRSPRRSWRAPGASPSPRSPCSAIRSPLFRGPAQLVFLAVAITASLVVARRRERFDVRGFERAAPSWMPPTPSAVASNATSTTARSSSSSRSG